MTSESHGESAKEGGDVNNNAPHKLHAGGVTMALHVLGVVLLAPFTQRTWAEMLYVIASSLLAFVGTAFVVVSLFGSGMLLVTLVGLPLLGLTLLLARWIGTVNRGLANALLQERIEPPHPFKPQQGLFGWLRAAIFDGTGWLAILYLILKSPLAVGTFAVIASFWGFGLFNLTHPLWWWLVQDLVRWGFVNGLGEPTGNGNFNLVNLTWHQTLALAPAGLACILAAPWVERGLVWLDLRLMRLLIGRRRGSAREQELEKARTIVAEDSAATLRRIERDLHDGTQVQLATLAMKLGQAKEKLQHDAEVPFDPEGALDLVDAAHRHAKEALVELRDIARGIHPPALDLGLDAALATLVGRSPVTTELHVAVQERPARAIETIAYFSIAELLANVAKHSRARHAAVDVAAGRRPAAHLGDGRRSGWGGGP